MSEMRFISLTPDIVITNHSHLNHTQHVLIAVPDVLARAEMVWCPSILPLYVKKWRRVIRPSLLPHERLHSGHHNQDENRKHYDNDHYYEPPPLTPEFSKRIGEGIEEWYWTSH